MRVYIFSLKFLKFLFLFRTGGRLPEEDREKKRFRCDRCSYETNIRHHLTLQSNIHSGIRPFQCKVYQKRFLHMGGLNSHLRIHTGTKPFKGEHCSISFRDNSNLREHIRLHYALRPYKCTKCDSSHKFMVSMKYHVTTKHETKTKMLHKCNECGYAAYSLYHLKCISKSIQMIKSLNVSNVI